MEFELGLCDDSCSGVEWSDRSATCMGVSEMDEAVAP
jgi:hypothetical protein